MQILGIIAEYNLFHNGHSYHIDSAKKISNADFVITVMSGNYVQRGEPAIINKYLRTKMALENGIDLVLELPVVFSVSSAQYFATAAINILKSTGIVNAISFGSEIDEIEPLKKLARIKNNFDVKKEMECKKSFATAFFYYVKKNLPGYEKFLTPNNILAIEYLAAMEKINWRPNVFNIKRKYSKHDESKLAKKISSALSIRNAICNNIDISNFIPQNCLQYIPKNFANLDNASNVFHYLIAQKKLTEEILNVNEGIENRIMKAAQNNFLISQIISSANSTRYTNSRLRRIILNTILNIKKDMYQPQYLRILGFKKSSQSLLKMLKKNSSLPIITNIKHIQRLKNNFALNMIKKEIEATDLYPIFLSNQKFFPSNYEYTQPVIIL